VLVEVTLWKKGREEGGRFVSSTAGRGARKEKRPFHFIILEKGKKAGPAYAHNDLSEGGSGVFLLGVVGGGGKEGGKPSSFPLL